MAVKVIEQIMTEHQKCGSTLIRTNINMAYPYPH